MDYRLLEKRLEVLDGLIPASLVVERLKERDVAVQQKLMWRKVAIGLSVVTLAALIVSGITYNQARYRDVELAVFRDICASPTMVREVIRQSEQLVDTNAECLRLHEGNRDFYRALLATHPDLAEATSEFDLISAAPDVVLPSGG